MIKNSIKYYRLLNKMEQKTLAVVLGVTAGCVCAWETGRNDPKPKYIKQLAELFNVSEVELMQPQDGKESLEDNNLKYDLKTPMELKEEFEAMEYAEQKYLLKNYESLGLEVIKQQCSAYKSIYRSYKNAVDSSKKDGLYFSLLALKRWFINKLHRWVVTEIQPEDFINKLQNEVDKESKQGKRIKKGE